MKRRQLTILLAAGAGLLLAACGSSGTSNGGSAASSSSSTLIHTQSIKVGDKTMTVLKDAKGLTLYYFTPDSSTTIACTGACASNWPPLLSSSDSPAASNLSGKLSVLDGPNGKQVLYNGHPLYKYGKDVDSGDAYGQGIGGKWFVATPDLAAASGASASRYGAY